MFSYTVLKFEWIAYNRLTIQEEKNQLKAEYNKVKYDKVLVDNDNNTVR